MTHERSLTDRLLILQERDRQAVAIALWNAHRALAGWEWLARETRRPVDWTDTQYRLAFNDAIDDVMRAIEPLRMVATNFAHTPIGRAGEDVRLAAKAQLLIAFGDTPIDIA